MISKPYRRFIVIALLIVSLLVGCVPATAQPSQTIIPSTNTFEPAIETPSPTDQPATVAPTVTQSRPLMQLTFISDRPCASCLYGIASSLYAIQVGCLNMEKPCPGKSQLLFEWDEWINDVDWSPDGSRLAFESLGALFISDWDGANVMKVPNVSGGIYGPEWSPDGSQIAFIYGAAREGSHALDPAKIYIYDLRSGEVTTVFEDVYDPSSIYWLPEGKMAYISKVSETNWTAYISIVGADGTIIQHLPETSLEFTYFSGLGFSPDAQKLAIGGEVDPPAGKTDIYVTDLDGNNITNLTGGLGDNAAPVWSPLGDWIAFQSNRTGNWDIYLIQPDGAHLIQVTQGPEADSDPVWRIIP